MSTDYKIGIVVGLIVLIAGIVYFLMSSPEQSPAPPVEIPPPSGPNQPVVDAPSDTTETVSTPEEISLETLPPATQPTTGSATGWELNETEEVGVVAETPSEDGEPETLTPRVSQDEAEDGFQLDANAEQAWSQPDPEPVIRTIPRLQETETIDQVSVSGGTYTVKPGDNGFWMVAERVYGLGNGKYWKRIRDANPTADTSALRPGMKLVIPPLPADAASPERTTVIATREPHGSVTVGTGGNRTYIVAEGDAGLWGVAVKVYDGKGHLWEHIQKANPGVDSNRLRPGMKLVIPPLPTTATRPGRATGITRTAGATVRHGEVYTENGRRYYIVQAGDKGYWGIAKKVYKDGKYSYLIDRANTGVDSYSLQPGDKLEVPPIPAGDRGPTGGRAPAGRPSRPVPAPRADEPDFGP